MDNTECNAIDKVKSYSETINKHLVYIFVFGNKLNSYQHWRNELSTFLSIMSNITIKPNNKKLNDDVYYEYLFPHIDTTSDANAEIAWAWVKHDDKNNSLPSLSDTLTDSLAKEFRDFKNEKSKELVDLLISDEKYTKGFFEELIDSWGLKEGYEEEESEKFAKPLDKNITIYVLPIEVCYEHRQISWKI